MWVHLCVRRCSGSHAFDRRCGDVYMRMEEEAFSSGANFLRDLSTCAFFTAGPLLAKAGQRVSHFT